MFTKLLAIFEAIKALSYLFKKFEEYIIIPFKKWLKKRRERQTTDHYQSRNTELEALKNEIEVERKKENTKDSDEKLKKLLRNLHNLGDKNDS